MRHVGNDELNNFAIVNMTRITGVEISKMSKCAKQTAIMKGLKNTVNVIYSVCAMSEMMIYPMFAIRNIMAIRVVENSKTSKCAKRTAISKIFKTL